MSYNYLFELYKIVDIRIGTLQGHIRNSNPLEDPDFEKGRLLALQKFRQWLAEHYDVKLPKRLLKKQLEKRRRQ